MENSDTAQNNEKDVKQEPTEKIIQPLTSSQANTNQLTRPSLTNKPAMDTRSIYPEARTEITGTSSNNASQAFAIGTMQHKSTEANQLVCLRVKSVLIIGILLLLTSLYSMITALGTSYGTFVLILGLIQLLMAMGLLTSKDHHNVSLILKIFVILQAITCLLSLGNPIAFVITGVGLILLCYAYLRVKSLSYY